MKNQLKFFLEVNKLKTMKRTGWVLRKVKNPETIAEHTFRVAITAWLLGQKKNLNTEQLIKTALFHDLCEVYAGDLTPFFYYLDLPRDEAKRKEMLRKWVRLSKKEKKKRGKKKNEIEKKSLLRLIKSLKPEIQKEIFAYWHDFEKRISPEGKLLRPVDKIETLLQAIEYFGVKEDTPVTGWWEEVEEMAEDPLLLDFLAIIQNSFYKKRKSTHQVANEDLKQELNGILRFILEVGKLKRFPRRIWYLLEVKSPIETVAEHIFSVALMAWFFGRQKPELNMGKLLKMALCHEMPSVYTNDLTPYDEILTKKAKKEVFKKWLRFPRKEKEKIHLKHYKKERIALKRLALKLDSPLRDEIIQLFDEYKTSSTAEARFLNQINVLAVLLQALLYWKKDKNLQIDWMWEWVFEKCDNQICLDFIEELKNKFYGKGLISKLFNLLSFHKR
jgi:putative hydrolase of HD superfamily